jgi:threonine dehydratase
VPAQDDKAFGKFRETLGYPYVEETGNPVYRLFLKT